MAHWIEGYEGRLLRWEGYLRRSRHVNLWLGIMIIVVPIVLWELGALPEGQDIKYAPWLGAFLIVSAYESHLKVRHIESIKFYRGKESNVGCQKR